MWVEGSLCRGDCLCRGSMYVEGCVCSEGECVCCKEGRGVCI